MNSKSRITHLNTLLEPLRGRRLVLLPPQLKETPVGVGHARVGREVNYTTKLLVTLLKVAALREDLAKQQS